MNFPEQRVFVGLLYFLLNRLGDQPFPVLLFVSLYGQVVHVCEQTISRVSVPVNCPY